MNGSVALPIAVGAVLVLVAPLRRRVLSSSTALARAGAGVVAASVHGAGEVVRAAVTGGAAAKEAA